MNAYTSATSVVLCAPYLLLVPVYVVLSPLCIISSSLFDAVLGVTFNIDEQTTVLILILLTIWSISAIYIVQLIRNRTYKSIFFYEFVFYLSSFNFILIGITYSMLRRINLVEEVLAKVFSTLLLVYFA
jgi:formate hydrogenlyase subunit 3/multisubunit Na+/H+ antiporter MnhD subunit